MAIENDPGGFDTITGSPDYYIEFLDSRTEIDDEVRVKRIILELLGLDAGMSVLDVGCGPGDDTRRVAQAVGPNGRVIGLDRSPDMISEARSRAQGMSVEFVEGDAADLEFADASFDRTRAERVFIHLPDPMAALREMVRVTTPGGLVVVSDIDAGTIFTNSSDEELTRELELGLTGDLAQGWLGRRLHRYFVDAGLENVRCVPTVILNSVAFMRRVFGNRLRHMVDTGRTTAAAVEEFWAELDDGERAGWLCSGVVCFTAVGRKPNA